MFLPPFVAIFREVNFIKDILLIKEFWGPQPLGENIIPISALISPWVFLYVFIACILLNLLSSGIPAWRASRLNIVEAIRS
jgi:ABC-type lipoprotein release transport system permease subunit